MACYGVFTGAREFAYRASVTSPLAGFGYSRLAISPGADLRDNGDHSYGKPGGVLACDSVFTSSGKAIPLSTCLRIVLDIVFYIFYLCAYICIVDHSWIASYLISREKRNFLNHFLIGEHAILNLHLIYRLYYI